MSHWNFTSPERDEDEEYSSSSSEEMSIQEQLYQSCFPEDDDDGE